MEKDETIPSPLMGCGKSGILFELGGGEPQKQNVLFVEFGDGVTITQSVANYRKFYKVMFSRNFWGNFFFICHAF